MKARILVTLINDGDEYVELSAIADEHTMDNGPEWLDEQVARVRKDFGNALETHGFVDVEIPDAVIARVVRRVASAGVVSAVPFAEPELDSDDENLAEHTARTQGGFPGALEQFARAELGNLDPDLPRAPIAEGVGS